MAIQPPASAVPGDRREQPLHDFSQSHAGIVSRLCDTYAAHAQFEERAYLPLAASILGENDQAALALTLHVRHALDVVVGPF